MVAVGQSPEIDSLKSVFSYNNLTKKERLEVLESLAGVFRFEPDSAIKYSLLLSNEAPKDIHYQSIADFHIGQAYKNKGAYEISIKYLFQSLTNGEKSGRDLKATYLLLGTVFGRIGDMEKSSVYFKKAIEANDDGDKVFELGALNNWAEAFYQNNYYDSAYLYFSLAIESAQGSQFPAYAKFINGNLGMVNLKLGNLDSAEAQLIAVLNIVGEGRTSYLTFKSLLAEVFLEKGDIEKAEGLIVEVIDNAKRKDFKEQLRDGYLLLSRIQEEKGTYKASLEAYRSFVAIQDSIKDVETVRKIGDMRTEYEVGQKQAEVDLLTVEKKNQEIIIIGVTLFAVVLIILAFIIYRFYQDKARINQKLSHLNQTKDKFFSIISHDLRGPVSSFMGISRLIKHMVKAKEMDQLLEVADDIDESVLRLSELLDNLLSWAMQQQGHFPNVPEKIHLQEAAHDLVKTLDTMAKSKSINLKTGIDEPIELWADKNTTMTILRNLVNNALKFTPEHGEVTITAKEIKGFAHIRVSDTGVGIPKEKVETLFKLQDKKSTYGTSGEKGLGLGLQLVYEFVEMNHGSISVNSREGQGTTFEIRLPLFAMEGHRELVR
ncbi:MAG: ATP-binding protein [Marinoscillum sp.]